MSMELTKSQVVLSVDDNDVDGALLERAFKRTSVPARLYRVSEGPQALAYLSGDGIYRDRENYPLPAVVFLDLKLPYISGHDVLAWIRQQKELESLVVIVLTSSNEASDLSRCYALGANSYLVKPPTPEQLEDLAKAFKWYWLEYNQFEGN